MPTTIVVIGGGPGGYVAAIRAAQLGASVTLIESDEIGGTCLNRGCMPTKALLRTSEVYSDVLNSEQFGIAFDGISLDWTKVQDYRKTVISRLTSGVKTLLKSNGVEVISGEARFTGLKEISIGNRKILADKVIIACGSKPTVLDTLPGFSASKRVIDSTECLSISNVPKNLLVIGGGVVGAELACVFSRYGTSVTIVEKTSNLLPGFDEDICKLIKKKLTKQGINIICNSVVSSLDDSTGSVTITTNGEEKVVQAEKILVSVGRKSSHERLNISMSSISEDHGFISTNEYLETSSSGIYAIGDCTGKKMYAHAAMAMGECAAENAMGSKRKFNEHMVPTCAYIGPEIAGIGFTEQELKEKKISYKVGKFPTSGNGRSLIAGHTDGLIKVLSSEKYGEILGIHILAPNATEMISEVSLALKLEATTDELTDIIPCHPSVSEALREAVLNTTKRAIHVVN